MWNDKSKEPEEKELGRDASEILMYSEKYKKRPPCEESYDTEGHGED